MMYAASEGKLGRVMKETRGTMSGVGLHLNEKKCALVCVKLGGVGWNENWNT